MKNLCTIGAALTVILGASAYSQEVAAPKEVKNVYNSSAQAQPSHIKKIHAPRVADAAGWLNREFYGGLIFSDEWSGLMITDVPYGIYKFSIGENGVTKTPLYTYMSADWMAGSRRRNMFYGSRDIQMFGALTGVSYEEVNLDTYTTSRQRMLDNTECSFADLSSVMCYNPLDDKIYSLNYNADLSGLEWCEFVPEGMGFDVISQFNGRFNVLAMAADPAGQIYCINADGDLYTINKSNGRVSLVGNTGVTPAMYTQSMEFDGRTGEFLWFAYTNTGTALYTVNPATAEATFVKKLDHNEQMVGLYFMMSEGRPAAPAATDNLHIAYDSNGAHSGNIIFSVPTKTGAGANLNGNVEVTVAYDGEILMDAQQKQPGTSVTIPFSTTEGNHYVAVTMKNNDGYGPVNSLYEYVGYDRPVAVSNVQYSIENGKSSLSWTAPTEGQNGGYIDPSSLYYQVWRMPENVLVADNLKATTFSETMPSEIRHYGYRIIPFNGSRKQGTAYDTETYLFGQSFEVPYARDFNTLDCIADYTVVDLDGDGSTWNVTQWNPELQCSVTYNQELERNNDWIISPNIHLMANNVYEFKMNLFTPFPTYPESFAYAYGRTIDIENGLADFHIIKEYEDYNNLDFTDCTATFTVPEDGDYFMAVIYRSKRGTSSMVRVKRQELNLIGKVGAPDGVTDLTITPDADGAKSAVISFKAPAKTMQDTDITGNVNIDILRDGTKVHTVNGATPSQSVEWTDNNISKAAHYKYTVIASNDQGEGMPVSSTAFIGIYEPPYAQTCLDKSVMNDFRLICSGFEDDPNYSALTFDQYNGAGLNLSHFNMSETNHDMYVVFPLIKFEDEAVYKVNFEYKNGGYNNDACYYGLRIGDTATEEGLSTDVAEYPKSTNYQQIPVTKDLILTDGGKKYLAFYASSRSVNDFTSVNIRNITIDYYASALAPDSVSNFKILPDINGLSKATLKFNAPALDFAKRSVNTPCKIEIYRGENSAVPAHTIENATAGQLCEWTDEYAVEGLNTYRIVASNSHGAGNPIVKTAYVGFDQPLPVGDYSIVPTADNQKAVLSWTAPTFGINGGVLDVNNLSYAAVKYNPNATDPEEQVEILQTDIKDLTFSPQREATDNQEVIYYGVIAVTPKAVSQANLYFTILGKPYEIPFQESFASGETNSNIWLSLNQEGTGLQCGTTVAEAMATFNGEPQDNDDGSFFFFNGAYGEMRAPISILTPKFNVYQAQNPVLRFWLYKGNQSGNYAEAPKMEITGSNDETNFSDVATIEWNESTPGWVEYTFPLDQFTQNPGALIFQITVYASGMNDMVFMDNFRITGISGIDEVGSTLPINVYGAKHGILTHGAAGQTMTIHNLNGMKVAETVANDNIFPIEAGVYVVTINGKSWKVVVK